MQFSSYKEIKSYCHKTKQKNYQAYLANTCIYACFVCNQKKKKKNFNRKRKLLLILLKDKEQHNLMTCELLTQIFWRKTFMSLLIKIPFIK